MEIYSDYLGSNVGGKYDFEDDHGYYNYENVFIPCKESLIIKLSDGDKHHTMAVDCSANGQRQLSFKLGRFVIDATSEEFDGRAGFEDTYQLEKDGDSIVKNDYQQRPTKFVVKSVETQSLEDSYKSKNIFVLVIDVVEGSSEEKDFTEGLKNPVKVSGYTKVKELKDDRFEENAENVGYLQLNSMKFKNLTKDSDKIEILVHSDLDKENSFVRMFSKKATNESESVDLLDNTIPCKTAMILVKTPQGQQMKMVDCVQTDARDGLASHDLVYKKALFTPSLIDALTKIEIAQDNENLKNAILKPIIERARLDIPKYFKKNGSFQRSMIQEMGAQSFDEQLVLAASDAELERIEISYAVKASDSQNMALIQMNDKYATAQVNQEGQPSMTLVYLLGILLMAGLSNFYFYHFVINKKDKTPAQYEAITEMKQGLVVARN